MPSPSFRFRLERVRALRERREDAAKQALAGALHGRQQCRAALADADSRLLAARGALRDAAADIRSLTARQAYLERMEQARTARVRELHRSETEVECRRGELSVAAQERQALERLKEQQLAAFNREAQRIEGQLLDEIAGQSYIRDAA